MTDEIPQRAELTVTISYEKLIPAVELGNLITAMARDYRSLSRGRTLAVARIASGSILIFLQDAYEAIGPYASHAVQIAKGTKALADFAKVLKEGYSALKSGKKSPNAKVGAYRTTQASLKLALDHDAEFHFKETGPDGETVEFTVTPKDAASTREMAKFHADQIASAMDVLKVLPPSTLPAPSIAEYREMMTVADMTPAQRASVATVVVATLRRAGQTHLILQLIKDLERSGLFDLAKDLRRAVNKGGSDNTEPPLLV